MTSRTAARRQHRDIHPKFRLPCPKEFPCSQKANIPDRPSSKITTQGSLQHHFWKQLRRLSNQLCQRPSKRTSAKPRPACHYRRILPSPRIGNLRILEASMLEVAVPPATSPPVTHRLLGLREPATKALWRRPGRHRPAGRGGPGKAAQGCCGEVKETRLDLGPCEADRKEGDCTIEQWVLRQVGEITDGR